MRSKLWIVALLAALCLPGVAQAQMYGETLHISLMGGYMFPNGRIGLDNGPVGGLGLGYNFTKNWGIEAFGYFAPNIDDDGVLRGVNVTNPPTFDNDVTMARLSVLYHFDTGSNFTPYISLGLGGQWIDRDRPQYDNYSSFAPNIGLGFKYFLNEVVALRLEVNDSYGFNRAQGGGRFNAPMVSAGLTFQVGAPSECRDSDNDGVCDRYDKCPGTPAGYRVDSDGCPITVTVRLDVKFDFDKSVVKRRYLPEVKKVADFLRVHNGSVAVVEGHTDSIGDDDYNQRLSERRANAVRDVLVNQYGVPADKISAVGYGEARPVTTNDTVEGRAENRRVVGVFTGTDVLD